jgi:hypothetical protein
VDDVTVGVHEHDADGKLAHDVERGRGRGLALKGHGVRRVATPDTVMMA